MNQTAGARLKKIRLDKGLSLEAVQKQTKINTQVLQALEGDGISTVSPVYLRSFLKIYCRFLGVDPKDFSYAGEMHVRETVQAPAPSEPRVPVAPAVVPPAVTQEKSKPHPEPKRQPRPEQSRPRQTAKPAVAQTVKKIKAYALAVADVSLKGLTAFYGKARKRVRSIKFRVRISKEMRVYLIRGIAAVIVLLIVIKLVVLAVGGIKAALSKRKVRKPRPVAHAVTQQQPVKAAQKPAVPAQTPSAPAAPAPKSAAPAAVKTEATKKEPIAEQATKQETKIRLIIRAKENSWVFLKSDGKVVFQRILEKGRFETWEAKEKMELSVGNAGGVELDVNGQVFSNLGRRKQALKNIVITKEGLKID